MQVTLIDAVPHAHAQVTSILSIMEDIVNCRSSGRPAPKHVYFVWMSPNVFDFRLLNPEVITAATSWPLTADSPR